MKKARPGEEAIALVRAHLVLSLPSEETMSAGLVLRMLECSLVEGDLAVVDHFADAQRVRLLLQQNVLPFENHAKNKYNFIGTCRNNYFFKYIF